MKRKFTILFIVSILMVFSVEIGFAQLSYDFNFIGAGARARAMGGAFIGVADDATAASWNPAGLPRLEKTEASVVGLYTTTSYSMNDEKIEGMDQKHGNLNFLSLAFPLVVGENNLVVAVAAQRVIDLYHSSETEYYSWETKGGVDAISPAVGLQLGSQVSVGAAVNIFTGKYDQEETYKLTNETETYTEKYSGSNVSIGVLFDLQKFRIGGVYKTPWDMTCKPENTTEGEEYVISMPVMWGVGLAWEVTEKLLLAVDYESRRFSTSEMKVDDESESLEMEDVNQFRLGAEYLIFSGDNIIPLRAGIKSDAKPFKDYNDEQVVGGVFTIGAGLIMGNVNLDFAAEFGSTEWDVYQGRKLSESKTNLIFGAVIHLGE